MRNPFGRTLLKTVVLAGLTFLLDSLVNLGALLLTLRLV
jgi:hypothetical protein